MSSIAPLHRSFDGGGIGAGAIFTAAEFCGLEQFGDLFDKSSAHPKVAMVENNKTATAVPRNIEPLTLLSVLMIDLCFTGSFRTRRGKSFQHLECHSRQSKSNAFVGLCSGLTQSSPQTKVNVRSSIFDAAMKYAETETPLGVFVISVAAYARRPMCGMTETAARNSSSS